MANETTNETATNETSTNETSLLETVEESGFLDALMDSPELALAVAVIGALLAYVAYTQPAVKALVLPYIKKYDDEIMDLLDDNLTKAQLAAFGKLDEVAQKHVKDAMLRNVILSAWDQNDDKFIAVVKDEAKAALTEAKKL